MPALSTRVIAWARARRDSALYGPGRVVARATTYASTFPSDSSAITYSATTNNTLCQAHGIEIPDCHDKWWPGPDASDPYRMTFGASSSLEFSFTGRVVRLMAHTESSFAQARIFIDGSDEGSVIFQPPVGATDATKPLWTSRTLDEATPHKLRMAYEPKVGQDPNGSFFIGVRSFVVESATPPASKQNSTSTETPPTQEDNGDIIGIAAGVSGAVALLLVLCAFAFWWYRRRRNGVLFVRQPPLQRLGSQNNSSSDLQSYQGVGIDERARRTISPWQASNSGSENTSSFDTTNWSQGHGSSNSLGVSLPGHHRRSSSTTELLPAQPYSSDDHTYRPQHSHYTFDADHDPAPVPLAQGLALDILPAPSTSARRLRPGGGARRRDASPTDTTNSYESWTSSDFGPVPEPFVADGPPVPALPPHLRVQGQTGRHGPSPLVSDEKRRAPPRAASGGKHIGPMSSTTRQSTLPPRYSTILD